jgi:hypothetical protein
MAEIDAERPSRGGFVSAWLPVSMGSRLAEVAAQHDRSVSAELRIALRTYLAAERRRGRAGLGGSGLPGHGDAEDDG